MLNCLLGSQALTWRVPETVLGVATVLLYFAWLLSFPTWGADVDGIACHPHWSMDCG
jgi:hypothetical protein